MSEAKYDLPSVRKLLAAAFNDAEINDLIFDLFPTQIYYQLSSLQLPEKIREIILHADRNNLMLSLLEYVKEKNENQYNEWFPEIMKNTVAETMQRQEKPEALKANLQQNPHQIALQDWEPPVELRSDMAEKPLLSGIQLEHILKGKNPLTHERTEQELTTLYQDKAFCLKHQCFQDLFQPLEWSAINIIYGQGGCGRTALAYALHAFQKNISSNERIFTVFIPSQLDLSSIQRQLADSIVTYIREKPTLLRHLSKAERDFLALLLTKILTTNNVLARIEGARLRGSWWKNAITPEQQNIWRQVGEEQLESFKQSTERTPTQVKFDLAEWLRDAVFCLQSLGFAGIHLILDPPPESISQMPALMRSDLFGRHDRNLFITLFVPSTKEVDERLIGSLPTPIELRWNENQLKEMVEHRFQYIADTDPLQCFEGEAYDLFIRSADKNPRQLIKLWKACLTQLRAKPQQFRISSDIVVESRKNLVNSGL